MFLFLRSVQGVTTLFLYFNGTDSQYTKAPASNPARTFSSYFDQRAEGARLPFQDLSRPVRAHVAGDLLRPRSSPRSSLHSHDDALTRDGVVELTDFRCCTHARERIW